MSSGAGLSALGRFASKGDNAKIGRRSELKRKTRLARRTRTAATDMNELWKVPRSRKCHSDRSANDRCCKKRATFRQLASYYTTNPFAAAIICCERVQQRHRCQSTHFNLNNNFSITIIFTALYSRTTIIEWTANCWIVMSNVLNGTRFLIVSFVDLHCT